MGVSGVQGLDLGLKGDGYDQSVAIPVHAHGIQ